MEFAATAARSPPSRTRDRELFGSRPAGELPLAATPPLVACHGIQAARPRRRTSGSCCRGAAVSTACPRPSPNLWADYPLNRRSRSELATTLTDESDMAALAITGLSSQPVSG